MITFTSMRLSGLVAVLATLLPSSTRAADADNLLPSNTAVVLTINLRQIFDSPLAKKHGIEYAKNALKSMDEVNETLEGLGLDAFKDLDRVTVASPGGQDRKRGLIIVRGRFDADKIKTHAEKTAKDDPDALKIRKVSNGVIYEVAISDQDAPLFVALLNKTTLVASFGKDYVASALKKEAGKSQGGLKNKDFQALLKEMDDKQSLAFAADGQAFKGIDTESTGDLSEKLDAIAGGLKITDGLELEASLSTKSAENAKQIKTAINDGINQGIGLLGLLGGQNKKIDTVVNILKAIKTTSKDKIVKLKAQVSAEVMTELFGKDDE